MKQKPVMDRILILQDKGRESLTGMEIPDSEKVKPNSGTVVSVGGGLVIPTTGERIPMTVKVGDKVIYDEAPAVTVEIEGVDYVLIKEGDLLVIL
jgi:chaperonin GroES